MSPETFGLTLQMPTTPPLGAGLTLKTISTPESLEPVEPGISFPEGFYKTTTESMRQEPRFTVCRGKVPYDHKTGKPANDFRLGVSFVEAFTAKIKGNYDDIGWYVETPYVLIDLDHCINPETGDVTQEAARIVRKLRSLSHVSPSGTGIHIIVRGAKPGDKCRGNGMEIYATKRFVRISDTPVPETPNSIEDRTAELRELYEEMLRSETVEVKQSPETAAAPSTHAPAQIQSEGSSITSKYALLMHGEIASAKSPFIVRDAAGSIEYPSQSEADAALALILAARHEGDFDKIDAEFRQSSLNREKWEKRQDYRKATINSAIDLYRKEKPAPKAESKSDGSSHSLVTRKASEIKTKRVKWLWPDRFPFGKLSVVAGNPDQGKSLVTMYIAAQLTLGQPMYGCTAGLPPSDVLVLAGEDDSSDTIVPRLQAMGADIDRVHIAESVTVTNGKGETIEEREAQLDTDVAFVEEVLRDKPEIRLIIIDPISNYLGNANMNREQEIRRVLIPIKRLAEKTGVSIISVMHLNKNSEASAIHRIGGAMAFSGVARAAWMFAADPTDETHETHMMLRIKGNIAKSVGGLTYKIETKPVVVEGELTQQPVVLWTGSTNTGADDLITDGAKKGRPSDARVEARDWLLDHLSSGVQTAPDVRRAGMRQKHSWMTLRRAADELKVDKFQEKRTWYWRLPEHSNVAIEVDH